MTLLLLLRAALCGCLLSSFAFAGAPPVVVPQVLNYQGRVAVNGVNFDGSGQFKFALVNGSGSQTFWSNDGTSANGSAPTTAVALSVSKGLYSVLLGDNTLANMNPVPSNVFRNEDVRLRVWFNDGTNGFQLLTPDQRIAATGYAMQAATVSDGSITAAKIATGAIGNNQLEPGLIVAPISVSGKLEADRNTSYAANSTSQLQIYLPSSAVPGDQVQITGTGSGGWAFPGDNWIARGGSARDYTALASSGNGARLAATVRGGQIYTSTDYGVSWTARDSNRPWKSIASSADGSKLLATTYAATPNTIYHSTNGGATWTPQTLGTFGWFSSVAMSADGSRIVLANDGFATTGPLFVSTDGGATWIQRDSARRWTSVAISSNGQRLVAVDRGPDGVGGRIYTAADGGTVWTPRESNRDWRAVASSADGSRLVAAAYGGRLYTSSDFGVTWTPRESVRDWSAVTSSADGLRLCAVGNSAIYVSTDGGVNWTTEQTPQNWSAVASSADGSRLTAAVDGGFLFTEGPLLSGGQGSAVTLQFLGDDVWIPVAQSQLAANSVGSAQLTSGAVTASTIAAGAVGGTQLAAGAVGTAQLAAGAVGLAQMGTGAVGSTQLVDGAVTAAKIGPGAVGSTQLADGAVTGGKLDDAVITSVHLTNDLTLPGSPRANLFAVDASALNNGTAVAPGLLLGGTSSGEGVASKRTSGTGQFNLQLYTGNLPRLTILNSGNIGIGTTNPTLARLQIVGATSTLLSYGYLNSGGNVGTGSPQVVPLSIHASDRIACTEFNAYSDERIKTVRGRSDAAADLQTLRQIEVTDYTFKDRPAKGDAPQKKVLAQQVERVFPQSVSRLTDVVPDIYRTAELKDGWIALATDLKVGERVRLIAESEQGVYEVLEVRPGAFRSSLALPQAKVFVYGREVNDFRSVDYDALAMLNLSATQELARQLEAKQSEVAALQDRVARLERLLTPTVAVQKASHRPARRLR